MFKFDIWNFFKYKNNAIYFYKKWDEAACQVSLLKEENEGLRERLSRYKKGQFKKGRIPWNKKQKS